MLIVASALPIALIANIDADHGRPAFCTRRSAAELANLVFHDLAGWLMMPVAMALLWVELDLLTPLLVEPPPAAAVPRPIELLGAAREAGPPVARAGPLTG